MENKANYAVVGLFTLLVIGAAFAFVFWFSRAGENGSRKPYQIVFTGSVSGLSRGSVVRFNGLRVGEVMSIKIMEQDPGKVVALVEVDQATPVKTDTRARLESQGLTGVASIQLTGGSARAGELVPLDPAMPPSIFADRSDFQDIVETVQRLSGKIDQVLGRADQILADGEGPFISTIKNVEAFSKALSDNSSGVASFLANAGEMSQRIGALSTRLERFTDQAEGLVRAVEPGAVNRIVNNAAAFSDTLNSNRDAVATMLNEAASLAKVLQTSAVKLDSALEDVSRITRAVDAAKINTALAGAEKFADALGRNADNVDVAMRDVATITAKVNAAADRLNNVMAGAESFLGAGKDGQSAGMMAEISEAARAIKTLADNLDKRTAEMSAGINRFTGPGLRELEALTADSRKAVGDLSRAVRSLERNPSQLLFGGQPAIPEHGRR
jgi:phospholipid/cholesterol/gamma-HCH transport system substrate-binding protein